MSTAGRQLHRALQRLARVLNRAELRDIVSTGMREVAAGLVTGAELVERFEYVERRRRNPCRQYSALGLRCEREAHDGRGHIWVVK